ncbi:tetratricopeptide repeat protein [Kangiella marina]|uniref:MalT-like TPR region domain-containing protein n=1 Tax=Kangiella marina TaxID=1079178 RepID=A0ABP8IIL8_9GAMM
MIKLLNVFVVYSLVVSSVFANETTTFIELKKIEESLTNNVSESAQKLESLSKNKNEFNSEEIYFFNLLKAHILLLQNKPDQSLELLGHLDKLETSSAGREGIKHLLTASINHYKGHSVEAFVSLDKSLDLLDKIKKQEYKSRILINAVGLYKDADLIDFSLDYGRRALVLANQLKDPSKICDATYELASIELLTKKYQMAENRLLSAKSYCEKAQHKILLLGVSYSILELRIETGKLDKAREIANELHPKMIDYGWDVLISASHSMLARLELSEANFKKAEEHAKKAYKIAKKTNDRKRMEVASRLLAQIYTELENDKEAIKFYKEYMELNDANKTRIRQRKMAFDMARRGKLE